MYVSFLFLEFEKLPCRVNCKQFSRASRSRCQLAFSFSVARQLVLEPSITPTLQKSEREDEPRSIDLIASRWEESHIRTLLVSARLSEVALEEHEGRLAAAGLDQGAGEASQENKQKTTGFYGTPADRSVCQFSTQHASTIASRLPI